MTISFGFETSYSGGGCSCSANLSFLSFTLEEWSIGFLEEPFKECV